MEQGSGKENWISEINWPLSNLKVDASETIVNKENLNLVDGGAQSIENSTISEMEILEDETPRFDEKFVKVNSSSHFFNFF